jgi:hypothetical protein
MSLNNQQILAGISLWDMFSVGCPANIQFEVNICTLFALKQIKLTLFACFSPKQISGFYMRNKYKRKQILLSKQIFYLFFFKVNFFKLNDVNIFKKRPSINSGLRLVKGFPI